MKLDELSDMDVTNLITAFKKFLEHPIMPPTLFGKIKNEEIVEDSINGIHYVLHYYRGNLENKYSIHLRFTGNNLHLVRLCINGSRHYNLDGSVVEGNHIHIYHYSPISGELEGRAYPLSQTNFDSDGNLEVSLDHFMTFTHIHQ
ncbi:DUF6978 family protein [Lacticaseibacillus saniviri]